jgi:multidrug resistance efflux pump
MTRCAETARWLLAIALGMPALPATAVVLTGEVQAVDAQTLFIPESNSSPVVVRYYLPEGSRVHKGQVLLRIDPGEAASQIPQLDAQIEQARAGAAKELAELQVKVVDAQIALVDAQAALATAKVDAGIPAELISRLDFERHQGELDRAARELRLKQEELEVARAAVQRRRQDGELEARKLELQRDFHRATLRDAELRADRDGLLIHAFNNNWLTGRIDEGSSSMPGTKAGDVVAGGAMRVQAWALEPDRNGLLVGMPVDLAFDALPRAHLIGHITAIAGAPAARPEWGSGRYFTVQIALPPGTGLALLPGMSVRAIAQTHSSASASTAGHR